VPLGTLYRTIMLENVSVDVVDGARVKGVLGCPSVPGRTEGVNEPRSRPPRPCPSGSCPSPPPPQRARLGILGPCPLSAASQVMISAFF